MCLQAETAEPLIYYVGDSYSGRGWVAGGGGVQGGAPALQAQLYALTEQPHIHRNTHER